MRRHRPPSKIPVPERWGQNSCHSWAQEHCRSWVRCRKKERYYSWAQEKDKASIGMIQRMFKVGFNRAARIVDQLADAGIVGPEEGTKPRKVLMSSEQLEAYFEEYL